MEYLPSIILLVVLSSPIITSKKVDENEQLVCWKKGSTIKARKLIDTSATNFKDFVRQSDVFVDKSLLVNLVAQNVSFISLTFPRKWGKSINLDMLKAFLETDIDEKGNVKPLKESWSYKFFKEGKITYDNGTSVELNHPPRISENEDVIRSYLCQYPVIYLNLSDFVAKSGDFKGFLKSFQEHIAVTFEAHRYVVEALQKESKDLWVGRGKKQSIKMLLEIFHLYRTHQEHSEKGMITSLEFLSSVLKSYFKKQVYILIDDFDAPIRKLCVEKPLRSDEARKVINFFRQFLISTFETNHDNMRTGIVTGVLNLGVFVNHSRSFSSANYNLLNQNTRSSLGFTRSEVDELLTCCSMDVNTVEKAVEYYSYYTVHLSLKIGIYDPWSMVNFVNEQKILNFRYVGEEFKETELKVKFIIIEVLMNTTSKMGFGNLTFGSKDLILLNNIMNGITTPTEYNATSVLIFKYLYACGFFELYDPNMRYNFLTYMILELGRNDIPKSVAIQLNLINCFKNAKRVAEILFEYFQYTKYKEFMSYGGSIQEIENLHKKCVPRSESIELKDFRYFHIFVLQFMKIKFHYDGGLNVTYDRCGEAKPYIVFRRHDHRAIVEFECGKFDFGRDAGRKALNRAKSFNIIFEGEPSLRTSFVGIALNIDRYTGFTSVQIDTNPHYEY